MSDNKPVFVQTLNHTDLLELDPSKHFNGTNYLQWAQFVRIILKGCDKLNHIEENPPNKDDPYFKVWDIEDSIIITWFWNSMTPESGHNCFYFSTAKEIWEYLRQTYFIEQNILTSYELENRILKTKQRALSVTAYYMSLKGLWAELDQYYDYQNFKMGCNEESATLTQFVERSRIFKFLSGLNFEFDQIRVEILSKDKLPSLLEVFKIVRGEESLARVLGSAKSSCEEIRVLSTAKPSREDSWCGHCRKSNHNIDSCFKVHGKEKVLGRHNGGFKGVSSKRRTDGMVKDSEVVKDGMVLPQGEGEFSKPLSKEELERLQAVFYPNSGKNSGFL